MQTSFIYSASKVNTLSQFLLNRTDIERLLVTESSEDLQSALKETYLAPYVVHVPNEDIALAIEATLIHAKKLIHRIAPQSDMFRVLWVQYDIHNLRVFAKASVVQWDYERCEPYLLRRGIYAPDYLYEKVQANELNRLQIGWQEAYDQALQTAVGGDLSQLDDIFDTLYFKTSKYIVESIGDAFMKTYLTTVIDLHNLKNRLRQLKNGSAQLPATFITGGSFTSGQLDTFEQVAAAFARLSNEEYWAEALEHYQTEGTFTFIDDRAADHLINVAKKASYDMFSSASIVFYYLQCLQSADNVRAIEVGKNSGMKIDDIRNNLRLAYVNE